VLINRAVGADIAETTRPDGCTQGQPLACDVTTAPFPGFATGSASAIHGLDDGL
jgi:hypothetical protein